MRKVLAFLALCLAPALMASNQHEHFYEFFPTDAFFEAYQRTFGRPIGQVTLDQASFRQGQSHPQELLKGIFGARAVDSLKGGESDLGALSLQELALRLAPALQTSPAQVLRQLFEFGPQNGRDFSAFIEIEHVRRAIMVGLLSTEKTKYIEFLTTMAELTARSIPLANRKVVALSVPEELYERDSLTALRQTLERSGTTAEYYLSYPRYYFTDPEARFQKKLALLDRSLKEGWAQGFDLTGSIYEKNEEPDPELTALYARRMTEVARVVGAAHGVFKVHSFEAADQGPFYVALWNALAAIAAFPPDQKPSRIVFGHLGAVTPADIARLTEFNRTAHLPIAFDGTFLSDEALHGFTPQQLVETIRELYEAGFEVGLGGDGQGILGAHDLAAVEQIFRDRVPPAQFALLWASLLKASQQVRAAETACGRLTARFSR